MRVFTKEGADRLQRRFEDMCKRFAQENGIVYDKNYLRYGSTLNFSAQFSLESNKNEQWDSMVDYFRSSGAYLMVGGIVTDAKNKRYEITGQLNPSKGSKFQIETKILGTDRMTYWTIDAMVKMLKEGNR